MTYPDNPTTTAVQHHPCPPALSCAAAAHSAAPPYRLQKTWPSQPPQTVPLPHAPGPHAQPCCGFRVCGVL